jgi:hypothetical protein
MLKKILAIQIAFATICTVSAQDSTKKSNPLVISGSVDAYYRYNFEQSSAADFNNKTSFTKSQNSFELGMASIKLDHTIGKVSATADLGFGRRAAEFSYNDGASLASVKQMYVSYAATDKVKFTLGKWATHVGYELVDAISNRNYSMSYMFSYGPFFHTGLKADIAIGKKSALMIGVANPTDQSTTTSPTKVLLAQFSTATKNDKLKAYINYQGGSSPLLKYNQFDVVLMGAISSKFSVNYDGSLYSLNSGDVKSSWFGSALYFNYDPTDKYGLTLRAEYFDDKNGVATIGSDILAITLSANYKLGPLTIIPELRLDNASKTAIFEKSNGTSTKGATTAVVAAVYKF